jgi:hypothetical protein
MQKQPEGLAFLFCIFGLQVNSEAVTLFNVDRLFRIFKMGLTG